ncbi:MBL fold metallo-hydrolase [Pendulispora brunnea]|uniref:MBL fold metallo-hydrolase n=1 Tax=Pendulispora brunnea TaxID=2905690 RepID=A0ABZ2KF75_9BACT
MMNPYKNATLALLVAFSAGSCATASSHDAVGSSDVPAPPFQDELLSEETVRVSEHVWAILGFPNIGIAVGKNATLVVDTGLGRRNGATAAKVATKLAPSNRLVLTTTHFHPEHAGGVLGFPAGTLLIRNKVQQDEMDRHGEDMIRMFAGQNNQWKSLLAGEQLRAPDETFDRERILDLGGGVTARLLWLGPAHTQGDELVFVDPDKTLISGDVVQNKVGPFIYGEGGTPASWIAAVDEVAKLGPRHVVPDHSPIGDGSLVEQEKSFLVEVRDRAMALERQGEGAQPASRQIRAALKKKYPDWTIDNLTGFVKGVYAK